MSTAAPARFYLVRHGRAEGSAASDAARRLTPEGRAAFLAHASALAARLSVSRIATSPLARARETAELLALATGAPLQEEAALAAGRSSAGEVLALALRLGPGTALVGHNPELAEAIARVAGRAIEVPPGTVAAVDHDGAAFQLAWLEAP